MTDRSARAGVKYRHNRVCRQRLEGENIANDTYFVPTAFVPTASMRELIEALDELDRTHAGTRVVVFGPWVPYSFTGWVQATGNGHHR
ncbi:GvpL/GvpF family gas vesicle protein [Streptomyces mirabilis]|uniref:GvpL/GvpF family gas vesicle protein n=1 Tax=Streptomyces mirabilis TaxID=68239 RepID=UPI003650E160